MKNVFFFLPPATGRNTWWTYFVTLALVFSGILGFGNIPLMLALNAKGYDPEQMEQLDMDAISAILGQNVFFTATLFPFIIGFFMLLIAFKFVHKRPVLSYFTTREKFDLNRFFTGFAVTTAILSLLFFISYSFGHDNLVWNFKGEKFAVLLLISLFIVPFQTGFEELLFRGYLMQLFGRATSKGIIVLLANGILFGLLHIMNPEIIQLGWFAMVFYIMSGVFAALLTLMDDGIELSWGYHTANNFMGILLVTNQWQVFQTDALFIDSSKPSVGWDMYLILFLCYPLLVFFFAKIYKWSSWKQRLFGKAE